jgi:hypothetical protein
MTASFNKNRRLDKEKLWSELLQVNKTLLFGCGSRTGRDYDPADDEGFVRGHAYTVLEAREIDKPKNIMENEERAAIKAGRKYTDKKRNEKVRLLKLRNPWGSQEYNGAWSDGSKEWTPDVMKELDHTFGDDGIFWIAYPDFLKFYPEIDRIRLIGPEWTVTQQWTAVKVPYTADYLDTSFTLQVEEAGPVVLVLSQPDDRYFQGLVGRYSFDLHFRVYKDGEDTYLLRSMESAGSSRSCSAELELDSGTYTILVKITATRYASDKTAEEVIKQYRESRREKLVAVGKSFDAVHSKGKLREMEENDAKLERLEEKAEDKEEKILVREQRRKERQRERARRLRREAEAKRKKEEKQKAANEKRKAEREEKKKQKEEELREKAKEMNRIKSEEEAKKAKEDEAKKGDDVKEATAGAEKVDVAEVAEVEASEDKPAKPKAEEKPAEEKTSNVKVSEEKTAEDQLSQQKPTSTSEDKTTDEKDSGSVTTSSTAPGQPTPESTPSPSSDGKEQDASPEDKSTEAAGKEENVPSEVKSDVANESKAAIDDVGAKKDDEAGATRTDEISPADEKVESSDATAKVSEDKDEEEVPPKEPGHDDAVKDDANEEQFSCHESEDDEPVSECSSVVDSDFSWDDAVDGSGEESTDSEADSDEDDLFKDDPWSPRIVIGLRVCSLDKNVKIAVKHSKGDGPEGHEDVEDRG